MGWTGWLCTVIGMSAQAFFGVALLDYYIFSGWRTELRITIDMIFFVAIAESKRRVGTIMDPKNWTSH